MGLVQKWKRFRNESGLEQATVQQWERLKMGMVQNGKGSEMGNGKLFRNENGLEMQSVQKWK